MESLVRNSCSESAVDIAHSIVLVICAIEPDCDRAARFQKWDQCLEGLLAIRCVMEDSDAVNVVKAPQAKGESAQIRPANPHIATVSQISGGHLCRPTQINSYH